MSQHYGVNGGDPKKLDSKHIVMDFEILQHLAKPTIISDIKSKLNLFVEQLQSARDTGKFTYGHACCKILYNIPIPRPYDKKHLEKQCNIRDFGKDYYKG